MEIRAKKKRAGFTLVEVSISMALAVLMSAGLYALGLNTRRSADRNRLAVEARSYAQERLEEIIATGRENLAKPSNTLLEASQVESAVGFPIGYVITRTPRVVWHDSDGSVVAAADAAYAEIHIAVSYPSPYFGGVLTDTYSTLLN